MDALYDISAVQIDKKMQKFGKIVTKFTDQQENANLTTSFENFNNFEGWPKKDQKKKGKAGKGKAGEQQESPSSKKK